MKILYSAGNRVGSNSQLLRFLTNLPKEYTVRVAAYVKSSHSLPHVDWTLDALHHNVLSRTQASKLKELFGRGGIPILNLDNTKVLLTEITDFEPDIVICDGEPVVAHIAKTLGIKLWYCSPIHLLDGINWSRDQLRYMSKLIPTRTILSKYPEPDKIFVYSPFGDVRFRPILQEGYEWMPPYFVTGEETEGHDCICVINDFDRFGAISKIINSSRHDIALVSPYDETFSNMKHYPVTDEDKYRKLLGGCKQIINTGETSYIADAIYNKKSVCAIPSLNDSETLLNSILVREYSIGSDLAQLELMEQLSLDELDNALDIETDADILSKQPRLYLHERIESCNT